MRLPLLLSSTLLLPLSLAQVRITRPDTDKKLNLSAPTITIAWAVDNGAAEASQIVDIWFQTTSVGSSNLGYQLVANYTFNAAGTNSYDWNPRDEVAALKSSGVALPTEKASVFELRFHERNSSRGSTVRSERYAVEGYELMSSAAGRVEMGAAVLVAGVVGLGGLLL